MIAGLYGPLLRQRCSDNEGGYAVAVTQWLPDSSFYPSPTMAMQAPPETLAYVAMLNPRGGSDAILTLDTRADTSTYGDVVGRVDMTATGDELHHFGWN